MTRYTPQWIQAGTYPASLDRRLLGALWPGPASAGCQVTAASGMTLNVAAGQVAAPTNNSSGTVLCSSDAVEPVTLPPAPPSGQNRIDLIICRPRGNDLDGGVNNDFIFDSVQGVTATAGQEVAPATPGGTVALARVLVRGAVAAIVAADITDVRPVGLAISGGAALPPLGAGAPFQSFTDPSGQVWVAKGGVYGGAWKRARDVLHSFVTRTSGGYVQSYWQNVGYDSVMNDPYGIFNLTDHNWYVPIAGIWQFNHRVAIQYAAADGVFHTRWRYGNDIGIPIGRMATRWPSGNGSIQCYVEAGPYITFEHMIEEHGAGSWVDTGWPNCWGSCDYIGIPLPA